MYVFWKNSFGSKFKFCHDNILGEQTSIDATLNLDIDILVLDIVGMYKKTIHVRIFSFHWNIFETLKSLVPLSLSKTSNLKTFQEIWIKKHFGIVAYNISYKTQDAQVRILYFKSLPLRRGNTALSQHNTIT